MQRTSYQGQISELNSFVFLSRYGHSPSTAVLLASTLHDGCVPSVKRKRSVDTGLCCLQPCNAAFLTGAMSRQMAVTVLYRESGSGCDEGPVRSGSGGSPGFNAFELHLVSCVLLQLELARRSVRFYLAATNALSLVALEALQLGSGYVQGTCKHER